MCVCVCMFVHVYKLRILYLCCIIHFVVDYLIIPDTVLLSSRSSLYVIIMYWNLLYVYTTIALNL